MSFIKIIVFSFCLLVSSAALAKTALTEKSIRTNMEEMLKYHVEYKIFNDTLAQRSLKLFLGQFDSEKIYLLDEEVAPFLEADKQKIGRVCSEYLKDKFSIYEQINEIIRKSIERARMARHEVEKELILGEAEKTTNYQSQLEFVKNESDLKKRIRAQMQRLLAIEQQRLPDPNSLDPDKKEKIFALWEKRMNRLEKAYLNGAEATHYFVLHILKAFAKSLDAHSVYFSEDEALALRASLEKEFEGVGVVLREGIDGIAIDNLIPGSPAQKSGQIQIGDFLVEINGVPTKGRDYDQVLQMMRERDKKDLQLGFVRPSNSEYFSVSLVPQRILMENERLQYTVEPFADGVIGKLILPSFYESQEGSCEKDIRKALDEIRSQNKLLGVVLDLRRNPGGFLTQALKVSGLFMKSGVVVIAKYAQDEVKFLRTISEEPYFAEPLVLLISKASASATEIVAQALQDYGVALVVGDERTYGKGSIQHQTVTNARAHNFFKVTIGRYYTVSGKSTQIDGVISDIVVPTEYFRYNIGERYLEFPLTRDFVTPAYMDRLADISELSRPWFERNYLPYLQKRSSLWSSKLAKLKGLSEARTHGPDYTAYLRKLKKEDADSLAASEDLPLQEAVNILKDMISIKLSL